MREGSGIAPDFQNEKVGEETIAKLLPKGLAKKELERGNLCHTKNGIWQSSFPSESVHCFLIIAYGG